MQRFITLGLAGFILFNVVVAAADGDWAYWRGASATGMARGDAPTTWSDTQGVRWKATVPGRGFSSPVVWGDRIFLTTAVPNDAATARAGLVEHRFVVHCYDRKTGKLLWERVAKTDTPHEPAHPTYGSFASNSPITDGKHVYAFFGSRGLHAFTIDGQPVWQKDFGRLRMFMTFGEGAWTWLEGETLLVVVDHEGESFLVALDKATGKERWRTPRQGNTNWSGPYVTTRQRPQTGDRVGDARERRVRPRDREANLVGARTGTEHHPAADCRRRPRVRDERLPESQSDGDPSGSHG